MGKATILIVEDEAIVAADLASKLRQLGYKVVGQAAKGEEAVELALRFRPDIVLMDIWLKGPMDGIEAAETIRNQCQAPVIYLTAHSDAATLARAKLTEPFGYILKPFEDRELATHIEMALYKHQVDRQLREQHEWLRVTLTSIGDAVIATDAIGRITFLNPVAETLTGWKTEEVLGQPIQNVFRVINEQTQEPLEDLVVRVLQECRTVLLANHAALLTRDGRSVPIEDSAAPILDSFGRLVGVVLVFHDVTEKRRAEEALKEADRRKDEFLAILAHELRNPLATLRNALGILRLTEDDVTRFRGLRTMMERQLQHLVRLVDDLLDVSRIARGKIELRKERLDVRTAVQSAIETSRPLIEETEKELMVTLPEQPLFVEGDPVRLAQVLANLLNNAAKYTPHGGRMGLTVERQGNQAWLRVYDNGMGIPQEVLPKIFEMFVQAHRTLDCARGGLGIGLTLVKSLVDLHGGTVEVHSAGPGQGAEFVVRLPLLADQSEFWPGPPLERDGPQTLARVPGRRILVVDDNQDSANSLGLLAQIMGHEVRTAYDGPSALALATAFVPEVVLLDVDMPGMDGYEIAQRLRQLPALASTVLVAQTGWGQEEDFRRAKEAGFDHHLIKPLEMKDLQKVLA